MHRDNHYVPRAYLKRWSSVASKVWAYRVLVPHERVRLWKEVSTRGIAFHEHLYTRVAASGESDEIERWLEREFETPAEDAIAKVIANQRLSRRDWRLLVRFFAAQDVRTPARLLENLRRWSTWLPVLLQRETTDSVARFEAMTSEERAALAAASRIHDDLPFRVTTERIPGEPGGWLKSETVLGRGFWLWSIRHLLSGEPLEALCGHRWTILAPPDGLTWFTSDDPVLKVNFNSLQDYNFGGGWGSVRTDLFLPLGPGHMLYTQVGKPVPSRGSRLDDAKAGVVRRLIAEHAHRYIFASAPDPTVPDLRPRIVDAAEVKREQAEWATWHADQTAAERQLMGW